MLLACRRLLTVDVARLQNGRVFSFVFVCIFWGLLRFAFFYVLFVFFFGLNPDRQILCFFVFFFCSSGGGAYPGRHFFVFVSYLFCMFVGISFFICLYFLV